MVVVHEEYHHLPRKCNGIVFCDVLVPAYVFVGVAPWMVIIWDKRECPAGENILAIPESTQEVEHRERGTDLMAS